MRASEFEFRFRFVVIVAFFTAGFWCYAFDPVNVAAMVAQGFIGHRVKLGVPADRHWLQAILGLGAALCVLAALVRTWAAAYLQSEVVHDFRMHGEGLVADGPYRYTRNPLYLGGLLLAIGFGMAASRLGFVVIVGGLTLFYYRLIAREESLLGETQGESYRQFLARVPRLVPSLRPRVAAGGLAPRWGQAVRGETFMWFFAAAAVYFAATLNQTMFVIIIAMGLASSVVVKSIQWRKAPDSHS